MSGNNISWDQLMQQLPSIIPENIINKEWLDVTKKITSKIIVLDDDPTGIQTVHSIPVYVSWDYKTLKQIFRDESKLVYILTNSRALTEKETEIIHRRLAQNLKKVASEEGQEFILISRGDSTLRGHYPLETAVLYEELSKEIFIDGEIVIPFFLEGGRFTFNDIHYVQEKEYLVPVGRTEFAKDTTFGYTSSDLKKWIEEKTKGKYLSAEVISISLEMLRNQDVQGIEEKLLQATNFNKVIVNALDYSDLKVFVIALEKVLNRGKNFLYRTASSFVQIIGGIIPKPLLTKDTLYPNKAFNGPGLILVGSYVSKTTKQLEQLKTLANLVLVEFDVKCAEAEDRLRKEINRVIERVEDAYHARQDVCVYTSRDFHSSGNKAMFSEQNLMFSTRVSAGLVDVVRGLSIGPGFLIAKGGITSSDIGVKGLGVKRAEVMGQIQPGIPVWQLDEDSRFPGLPYVIFPGNVGDENTLKKVVEILKF